MMGLHSCQSRLKDGVPKHRQGLQGQGAGSLKAGSAVSAGNLGESVLLPFRLPVPRLYHPGGVLFTDQHRHGVLPAVCRGEGNVASTWG